MNVKRWTALLVVGLLLQACAAPAIKPLQAQVEANLPLSAIAYDPQTGTELYTRHAAYSDVGGRLTGSSATYRAPDGAMIAMRRSVYSTEEVMPEVELTMSDSGETRGLRPFGEGNVLKLWSDNVSVGRAHEDYIRNSKNLFADGDLERYVLLHLDELESGKDLRARFVSLSALRSGTVHLRKVEGGETSMTTIEIEAYSDQLMPGGTAQLRIDRPAGRFVDYLGPSELVLQPDQPLTIRLVYVY
ncbi:MAG: hypothetical protein VX836_17735 [Pseudomonadota bacterium]|nr:hypothetical protein [Pseudomonadota bacterium]